MMKKIGVGLLLAAAFVAGAAAKFPARVIAFICIA